MLHAMAELSSMCAYHVRTYPSSVPLGSWRWEIFDWDELVARSRFFFETEAEARSNAEQKLRSVAASRSATDRGLIKQPV
jgi:hypothetical protein